MTVSRNSAKHPRPPAIACRMNDMGDLDLMIQQGWGDTPQTHMPANWRTVQGPGKYFGAKPREVTKAALDHTVNR